MQQVTKLTLNTPDNTQLFFMPRLYDETMQLLVQSKNYFKLYSKEDQAQLSPLQRLIYSTVMSRITLRLSTTMTWVLARRAFHAGEISQEEMDQHYRLMFQEQCLQESTYFEHFLPSFVQKLCKDTLALYSRIHALDNVQPYQPQAHSA